MTATAVAPRTDAVLRQAASLLLGYPDENLREVLPLVRAALEDLADNDQARDLLGLARHLERTPPLEAGAHYVHTFDMRRRRALHLTFYTDGDTRRRGHALARLKEVYAAHGWELDACELPDHLAVVLEFAARGDAETGTALLRHFQPGLELLRAALHKHGTPYTAVVDAVCATLPPPGEAELAAVQRLAMTGPPAEDVGLDPYGSPVDLGMPGGAR